MQQLATTCVTDNRTNSLLSQTCRNVLSQVLSAPGGIGSASAWRWKALQLLPAALQVIHASICLLAVAMRLFEAPFHESR